jgi:transcriptional regulator with XRE-family HTH domain
VIAVAFNEVIAVADELGRSLLEQPANWAFAHKPEPPPETEPVELVTPAELFRRSQRALRLQRGWTLVDLAVRVEVLGQRMTRNRVSDLETGTSKHGPSLDELAAIAYAFNVAPIRLLEGAFLPGPLNVAITPGKTTSLFGFRSWLRGRTALRTDTTDYHLAVADEDYLAMQRITVQLLAQEIHALIEAAENYRDEPNDRSRHGLADTIDTVGSRLGELERSQTAFPSQRPKRQERRGRPRRR